MWGNKINAIFLTFQLILRANKIDFEIESYVDRNMQFNLKTIKRFIRLAIEKLSLNL